MSSRANHAFASKLAVQNAKKIETLTRLINDISENNINTVKTCNLNVSASVNNGQLKYASSLSGFVPTKDNCAVFFGLGTADLGESLIQQASYAESDKCFQVALTNVSEVSLYVPPTVLLDQTWLNVSTNGVYMVSFCQHVDSDFNTKLNRPNTVANTTVKFHFI
jgi:hypothetical protein